MDKHLIGWKLSEYKLFYYYPHLVHKSRHSELEVPDAYYDDLEIRYLLYCRETGTPNYNVHKHYPGFDDVKNLATVELDFSRASVKLVAAKLATPK